MNNLYVNTSFFVGNYFSIPLPIPYSSISFQHLHRHRQLDCAAQQGCAIPTLRGKRETWTLNGVYVEHVSTTVKIEFHNIAYPCRPRFPLTCFSPLQNSYMVTSLSYISIPPRQKWVYQTEVLQQWRFQPQSGPYKSTKPGLLFFFGPQEKDPRNLVGPTSVPTKGWFSYNIPGVRPFVFYNLHSFLNLFEVCREPNPPSFVVEKPTGIPLTGQHLEQQFGQVMGLAPLPSLGRANHRWQ